MPAILDHAGDMPDPSLRTYLAGGGYRAWTRLGASVGGEEIVDIVERSGLTGKGGAGFPTHRKLRLMSAQAADKKYVVLNGSEHEPGSVKDRHLLEVYPHKVLEGALILALAVKASHVVVAINEVSAASTDTFCGALREAQADPDIDFAGISVQVRPVPDIYIVGEESALLEVLEGRKPQPRKKPPYPIQEGLYGFPTLIQNIETAAHLPFIMSAGADAYRALGIDGQGATLCTLGGEFARPGVFEIPVGTPIREILYGWGGGLRDGTQIKAIQPGGPSSGFLAAGDFDLSLDARTLTAHGSALGCAVIRAYSVDECMVARIGEIMHFFSHGSCGQCPRCRMETNMLDTIVKQVLAGKGSWKLLEQVDKLIGLAKGEGKCSLIDMPVAPIKTGLALFSGEFATHIGHTCSLCARHAAADSERSTMNEAHADE